MFRYSKNFHTTTGKTVFAPVNKTLFSSFFSCSPVNKIDVFELALLSADEVCLSSSFRATDASEDDDDELTGCKSVVLLLLLVA